MPHSPPAMGVWPWCHMQGWMGCIEVLETRRQSPPIGEGVSLVSCGGGLALALLQGVGCAGGSRL